MSFDPKTDHAKRLLFYARMFRASNPDVVRACLVILDRVATGKLSSISWHTIRSLLEDLRLGVPGEDVWDALLGSHLFDDNGSILLPRTSVSFTDLYEEVGPKDASNIQIKELLRLLAEQAAPKEVQSTSLASVVASVARVQRWAFECLEFADRESLQGFPVFWECGDAGHRPFGSDFGSVAASDTLLLWVEPLCLGFPPPRYGYTVKPIMRAWVQLLDRGDTSGGWQDGSMHVSYFDDDFVGAFMRERGDMGSCPTTEASAERLYALCRLITHASEVDLNGALRARSRVAVDAAARCILRWQDPIGAWAIHRYESALVGSLPVRDVSSKYAAEALLMGLTSGVFGPVLAKEVESALHRFADFLIDQAQRSDDQIWWKGDFAEGEEASTLRATILMASVAGRLGAVLNSQRVMDAQRGAARFIANHWQPNAPQPFMGIEFRVPTWEGPSLTTFSWEIPTDPLVITTLLDTAARGNTLGDTTIKAIEAATAGILTTEIHGHWQDFLLGKAFSSNSLHFLRGLLSFITWEASCIPQGIALRAHQAILPDGQGSHS